MQLPLRLYQLFQTSTLHTVGEPSTRSTSQLKSHSLPGLQQGQGVTGRTLGSRLMHAEALPPCDSLTTDNSVHHRMGPGPCVYRNNNNDNNAIYAFSIVQRLLPQTQAALPRWLFGKSHT